MLRPCLGAFPLALALLACGATTRDPAGSSSAGSSSAGSSSAGSSSAGSSSAGSSSAGSSSAGASSQGGTNSAQGGIASAAAGTSGSPTSGGASAGTGSVAAGAECGSDEDCLRFEDCCSCSSVPAANPPAQCKAACDQSACVASGLADVDAVCLGDRCVMSLSCVRSEVTCRAAEPECEAGKVPSVVSGCWGPCVAPSQCFNVDSCADCNDGEICVQQQNGVPLTQCVKVSAACSHKPTCECVDACFAQCSDENGIGCYCISC